MKKITLLTLILLIQYAVGQTEVDVTRDDFIEVLVKTCDAQDGIGEYRLKFEDGQILDAVIKKSDACRYSIGEMTQDELIDNINFTPVTRGPLIWERDCEVHAGMNCLDGFECSCYENQQCNPESKIADAKGCVTVTQPEYSTPTGGDYSCKSGYVWNAENTACVPIVKCIGDSVYVENRCQNINHPSNETICFPALTAILSLTLAITIKI